MHNHHENHIAKCCNSPKKTGLILFMQNRTSYTSPLYCDLDMFLYSIDRE